MFKIPAIKRFFITILLLMIFSIGYSQEMIRKEVRVVQPYAPTVFEAFKINLLPSLKDTTKFSPDFRYEITPKPYSAEYSIRPIKAAKLLADPLPKLYGSYLKMGLGNYMTPLAELNINKKRSKKYSFGAYARHISSNYKEKLENDNEVFAGYVNDEFDLYGKRIWDNSILSGSAGLDYRSVYYYGYNSTLVDTILEKEDIKQDFLNLNAKLTYRSRYIDSDHLNYNIQVKYNYFVDKFSYTENNIFAYGEFSLLREGFLPGVDFFYNYIDKAGDAAVQKNSIIGISPWFRKESDEWRLKAGIDAVFDVNENKTSTHIYPDALLQIDVVDNILNAYFGVSGNLEVNNFQKIAWENPYVRSGLQVRNSDHRINFFGGLNGNFNSIMSFKLKGSYELVNDMYFYVNDTLNDLGNQFYTEYDDVHLTTLYGEISTRPKDNLSLFLCGNYYEYRMTDQDRPWHKPAWDLTVSSRYNLRDKILVNVDIIGSGKRYAKIYDSTGAHELTLDGIVDINFGIEYRYTKILSAFLRFYNITSSRYQKWNQYPGQGFIVMGGITYSL